MDYYKILNVNSNSTTKEIKKKYYEYSKIYHPDKTNNNKILEEKFKLIGEAYNILTDQKKRFIYDIKLKYGIDLESFNLSEDDYIMLFDYYNKIMNMTEIKLLKLLYKSLPLKKKSLKLATIHDIKYIDISKLNEDYILNLFLKFNDIYDRNLKQVIIFNNNKVFYLFITYFNYKINIKNNSYKFTINIVGNLDKFKKKENDLIYDQNISLYQYHKGDTFNLNINNKYIEIKNKLSYPQIIQGYGLKDNYGNRGNLIINFSIILNN